MFKKIARKILKDEIDALKKENKELSEEYRSAINEHRKEIDKDIEQMKTMKENIDKLEVSVKNLSSENEIMKKYYHLDSEPTDEEKTKIRIDLRIHDLEQQVMISRLETIYERLSALSAHPYSYHLYPQPYFIR